MSGFYDKITIARPDRTFTVLITVQSDDADLRRLSDDEFIVARQNAEYAIRRIFAEMRHKHRCVLCGPVPPEDVFESEDGGYGHSGCWRKVTHR